MSDQKCREAFEDWFSDQGQWPAAVERNPDGNYKMCSAHSAWVSWKAGWSNCQGILDNSNPEVATGWAVNSGGSVVAEIDGFLFIQTCGEVASAQERAHLIAAAPDMYEALKAVNKLIAEGCKHGFNYEVGDWAECLFHSQQKTSGALKKAEGKS